MSPTDQGPDPPKASLGEWITILVVVAVVAGLGVAIFRGLTRSEDRFTTGDCLQARGGGYEGAACDEPKAAFKVFATKAAPGDCVDVPGTSRTYHEQSSEGGSDWYCIGRKDIDPAKAINGVAVGDCVVVKGSASAERAPCGTTGGRPVLKVLKDVLKLSVGAASGNELLPNECVRQGAPGTKLTYSWGLEQQGPSAVRALSWDRVLCLGA